MRHIVLLINLVILAACSQSNPTTEDRSSIRESINNNLDNWHKNAAEANFKPYFDCFDSDGVFIGTDASEIWNVEAFKEFSKPYFDKGEAWSFTAKKRNIYISKMNNVVWFDELLDTWMGTCRGSGVFEKDKDQWKMKHYVLSLTVPNEKMDTVIEVIK